MLVVASCQPFQDLLLLRYVHVQVKYSQQLLKHLVKKVLQLLLNGEDNDGDDKTDVLQVRPTLYI